MSYNFPKTARILHRSHFRWLARNGRHYSGKWVVIEFAKARQKDSDVQLGVTVTKRYGKAHDRNRMKRIVREAYRLCRSQLPLGVQMVVRPKVFLEKREEKLKSTDVLADFLQFVESLKNT